MSSYFKKFTQKLKQQLEEMYALRQCAATELENSEGEFRVCYGNPFILQSNSRK